MTYRKLDLIQGTPQWKAERLLHLTASQAPVLFGIDPYQERFDLYREKRTGRERYIDTFTQELFDRGHEFEREARSWAEHSLGFRFASAVLVSLKYPDLLASLDGLDEEVGVILEAKLIGAAPLKEVRIGKLKPHHICQVQAQLLVSNAKKCLYVASDLDGNQATTYIYPDTQYQARIAELARAFMQDVRDGRAPPPPEGKFERMKRFVESTYQLSLGRRRFGVKTEWP